MCFFCFRNPCVVVCTKNRKNNPNFYPYHKRTTFLPIGPTSLQGEGYKKKKCSENFFTMFFSPFFFLFSLIRMPSIHCTVYINERSGGEKNARVIIIEQLPHTEFTYFIWIAFLDSGCSIHFLISLFKLAFLTSVHLFPNLSFFFICKEMSRECTQFEIFFELTYTK